MKKVLLAVICSAILLSACATSSSYFTDPDRKGYTKPHYRGTCLDCNKEFVFSKSEFDNSKDDRTACPYCGSSQDMKMSSYQVGYDEKYKIEKE